MSSILLKTLLNTSTRTTDQTLIGDSSNELNKNIKLPLIKTKLVSNSTKSIKVLKFDDDTPNEFTNDYNIRLSELVIIVFIIILWILSLRKFFKNFDKIRTTHYREIPYKYRLKDPENLSKIRICRYPSQGVIFTNDPVANVVNGRQFSLCQDLIMPPKTSLNNRQTSPVLDEKYLKKKKFNIVISEAEDNNEENSEKSTLFSTNEVKDFYEDIEFIDNNTNTNSTSNEKLVKSNNNPSQSCSLINLSNNNYQNIIISNTNKKSNSNTKKLRRLKRQDDSSIDEQIYHKYFSSDQKRHLFRNSEKQTTTLSLQKKFYIDHLTVSPVIKESIFDLHKRSLEKMSRHSSGNSNLNSPVMNSTKRNSLYVNFNTPKVNKLSSKMMKIRYSDCSSLSQKLSFYNQSSESFI